MHHALPYYLLELVKQGKDGVLEEAGFSVEQTATAIETLKSSDIIKLCVHLMPGKY